MLKFINVIQHLLPRGRAWSIVVDKLLRRFWAGFTGTFDDVYLFFYCNWLDLFPATTRKLEQWEQQFNLPAVAGLTDAERRARLAAAWQIRRGGQSPRFVEDTLQAAGFDVYVHEWWVPDTNPPVARDPRPYFPIFVNFVTSMGAGFMQMGRAAAVMGKTSSATLVARGSSMGKPSMQMGDPEAFMGDITITDPNVLINKIGARTPSTPPLDNPVQWRYFYYIGGETWPAPANVPEARREEFDALILKISPAQQWVGLLVNYI